MSEVLWDKRSQKLGIEEWELRQAIHTPSLHQNHGRERILHKYLDRLRFFRYCRWLVVEMAGKRAGRDINFAERTQFSEQLQGSEQGKSQFPSQSGRR